MRSRPRSVKLAHHLIKRARDEDHLSIKPLDTGEATALLERVHFNSLVLKQKVQKVVLNEIKDL